MDVAEGGSLPKRKVSEAISVRSPQCGTNASRSFEKALKENLKEKA